MPVNKIQKSIFIMAPFNEVVRYAEDPITFSQWDLVMSDIRIINGAGEVGTKIEYKFIVFGMDIPVVLEVTEIDRTAESYIWTAKFQSGIASGIDRKTFVKKYNGTEVTDEREFDNSFDNILLPKLIESSITFALENLKLICETK